MIVIDIGPTDVSSGSAGFHSAHFGAPNWITADRQSHEEAAPTDTQCDQSGCGESGQVRVVSHLRNTTAVTRSLALKGRASLSRLRVAGGDRARGGAACSFGPTRQRARLRHSLYGGLIEASSQVTATTEGNAMSWIITGHVFHLDSRTGGRCGER